MQTVSIGANPSSVGALSVWNGYEAAYGEVRYTRPGADGGEVVFTLPEALRGAVFHGARLRFDTRSDAGERAVRYAGTSQSVTDANLLSRLQAGETEIRLYFSFRATGAGGGEGAHSAACTWSGIALQIDCLPLSGAQGSAVIGGTPVSWHADRTSLQTGDSFLFSVRPGGGAQLSGVLIDLDGGEGEEMQSFRLLREAEGLYSARCTLESVTWQGRVASARLRIRLITAAGETDGEWLTSGIKLVREYLPPAVSCEFTDANALPSLFGGFVQGKSDLRCRVTCVYDTLADEGVTPVSRSLALGSERFESGSDEFSIGAAALSGRVPYVLSVTDSHGLTGTLSGEISVLPYASPGISELTVQRYSETVDETGAAVYAPDDGSRFVRVTLKGTVSALGGANAWTLSLSGFGAETLAERVIASGADGTQLNYELDRALFAQPLSEQSEWTLVFTLRDFFEEARYEYRVGRAGGIFNIESGGAAVGMRSTGTRALKKFEVAYPATFYGEVAFPGMDGGWEETQLLNAQEADAAHAVRVRKIGSLVFLRGGVKLLSALSSGAAGSDAGVCALLNVGLDYAPAYPLEQAVVPDRTECCACLKLDVDGTLTLYNRSGHQIAPSALIPVNLCYLRT